MHRSVGTIPDSSTSFKKFSQFIMVLVYRRWPSCSWLFIDIIFLCYHFLWYWIKKRMFPVGCHTDLIYLDFFLSILKDSDRISELTFVSGVASLSKERWGARIWGHQSFPPLFHLADFWVSFSRLTRWDTSPRSPCRLHSSGRREKHVFVRGGLSCILPPLRRRQPRSPHSFLRTNWAGVWVQVWL